MEQTEEIEEKALLRYEDLDLDNDEQRYRFLEETCEIPHYKDYFVHNGRKIAKPYCIRTAVKLYTKEILPDCLGFYHLFYAGKLVYIGMSRSLRSRLLYHLKDDEMIFDAALLFPAGDLLNVEQVLIIETHLIKHYKPSLNTACISAY